MEVDLGIHRAQTTSTWLDWLNVLLNGVAGVVVVLLISVLVLLEVDQHSNLEGIMNALWCIKSYRIIMPIIILDLNENEFNRKYDPYNETTVRIMYGLPEAHLITIIGTYNEPHVTKLALLDKHGSIKKSSCLREGSGDFVNLMSVLDDVVAMIGFSNGTVIKLDLQDFVILNRWDTGGVLLPEGRIISEDKVASAPKADGTVLVLSRTNYGTSISEMDHKFLPLILGRSNSKIARDGAAENAAFVNSSAGILALFYKTSTEIHKEIVLEDANRATNRIPFLAQATVCSTLLVATEDYSKYYMDEIVEYGMDGRRMRVVFPASKGYNIYAFSFRMPYLWIQLSNGGEREIHRYIIYKEIDP